MNSACDLCPRGCNVDRKHSPGFCGEGVSMRVARAALHFWEEPSISGTGGSGAVFFTGCNLKCIFCQNAAISEGSATTGGRTNAANTARMIGKEVSTAELADIFFSLKEKGAHNINLVTPTHFVPQIRETIILAKKQGFDLPIVYNSSAYESVETLRLLEGLIDVYLPDFKYMDAKKAKEYSHAQDYPEVAKAAVKEMFRQVGEPVFYDDKKDNDGMEATGAGLIMKGVIVRHLVLPLGVKNACDVIDYLAETYSESIYISVMSQYTPLAATPGALTDAQKARLAPYPELARRVTKREYERVIRHCCDLGLTNVYIQEGDVAKDSFIPIWDIS